MSNNADRPDLTNRADAPPAATSVKRIKRVPLTRLPGRQRAVLDQIVQWYRATNEPCPGAYISRRLSIHHSTVQRHISLLHRKGWLRGPNPPAVPVRSR